MYSNYCCSCLFEPGQSSHKMYSNNILNFQVSTTILNACTKKSGNLLKAPRIINCLLIFILLKYEVYIILIILFTNPSARAGYDTRSIFKRSLTGLNSEFSFS